MQARLGRFRLNAPRQTSPSPAVPLSESPVQLTFSISLPDKPALVNNTKSKGPSVGTFAYDLAVATYPMKWESWVKFQEWLLQEQRDNCIELRLVTTKRLVPAYERKCRYVCSRHGTGGVKSYTKLHPEWNF
jgi:hypothetical protein